MRQGSGGFPRQAPYLSINWPAAAAAKEQVHRGCTEAEIAAITGQIVRDVRSILDAKSLHRDPALAEAAESRTKTPDRAPDWG